MMESSAVWDSVPTSALTQAVVWISGDRLAANVFASPVTNDGATSAWTYLARLSVDRGSICGDTDGTGSVCSQGCAGSPISRKSVMAQIDQSFETEETRHRLVPSSALFRDSKL